MLYDVSLMEPVWALDLLAVTVCRYKPYPSYCVVTRGRFSMSALCTCDVAENKSAQNFSAYLKLVNNSLVYPKIIKIVRLGYFVDPQGVSECLFSSENT